LGLKVVREHLRGEKFDLQDHHPLVLDQFRVERNDRKYQFFKQRPLSIPLFTEKVVWQKMEYVHNNPVQEKWRLVDRAEDYVFSSASLYANGDRQWPFLRHFWYDME
jgi:putative transposase